MSRAEQMAEIKRLGEEYLAAYSRELRAILDGESVLPFEIERQRAWDAYTGKMLAVFDEPKFDKKGPPDAL